MPSKPKSKPVVNGTPEVSEILTLAEAAAFLKVSEETLRREAELEAIPARRIGLEWRFSKAAILEWLKLLPIVQPTRNPQDLKNWLIEFRARYPITETEEEAEAFLKQIYDARKSQVPQ
jgi:excisionase family DNA binding protein